MGSGGILLKTLLAELDYQCCQGDLDVIVTDVVNDSRKAGPGSLFLCIHGAVSDGHDYAAQVAEQGACVLVVERPVQVPDHVTVIQVKDSRYAMACISACWFGHPARELKTIGITGTKGKTTATYMIKSIPEWYGRPEPAYPR